ncbi:TonB-dependent receptor [Sphingomonas sp. SUN019]|uniref:TonB-dependent receptor n=1 Tax=Sphingomonas sp. SUN019 TaxID=2937788 RepID=UPI00216466C0|nr:TonB-dependent receptor [Sphingomonas sp. SUN019]UVO51993.1 TonB-dependent receptor [Sphingomonas sp. SUN019]
MSRKTMLLGSISAIGLLIAAAAPVAAQTNNDPAGGGQTPTSPEPLAGAPVQPQPQSTTSTSPDYLGADVIVTAQKREENINKVGLTIAAIGSEALAERSIQSLSDLAAAVPGLSYVNSANNTPVYNLRGVGFYDTSLGSYPTTSVYLDQVPLPFPVLTNLTAFDLERVEVLKGPQGTLFGQNSTGGAINYIANKPTAEFHAGFDATYGRFDQIIGNAYVSGPLSSTLRARLAARVEDGGPWQYSYTRPGDRNGRMENYAGRLLVDWAPTDTISFELNLNGWKDKNQPTAVQYSQFNQQAITNVSDDVRNYPLSPNKPRAADWSENNRMFRNLRFAQASLRADWEFIPGVQLTSITSYVDFKQRGALDQDGINFDDIDLRFFRGKITSFSQELRLANVGPSSFRWIVGANYSRDKVFYRENIVYGDGSGGNNQVPPFQIESSENFSDQKMRNYAVFANGELDLSDQFSIKGGVRYTKAERRADICNVDGTLTPDGGPANRNFRVGGANRLFDLLADLFAPGNTYPDILPGGCFNLNDPDPRNPNLNQQGPWQPGLFTSEINEDNISWRGGIDFKPTETLLLYANVSKGYKAGGFGNINAAIDFQFRPVVQESILAYEAGFKAQLDDRRLTINGAAFYLDYKDKQLRTKDINPIFGIIDALNNVPKSHIQGFELEANVTPARGWNFGAAVTYIESEIDEYTGINAGGVVADFKGTVIPFTPKWQIGANGRYETPLSGDMSFFLAGQVNHRSKTFAAIGGSFDPQRNLARGFEINDYVTVDAQVGVRSDAGWRAMVWGKNLTNQYYWTNVVAGQDQLVRYPQRPATYGITFGYDF